MIEETRADACKSKKIDGGGNNLKDQYNSTGYYQKILKNLKHFDIQLSQQTSRFLWKCFL